MQMAVAGAALALPAARFDASQWVIKRTINGNFGLRLPNATVALLASKLPSGEGSLVEPVFTSNIVVSVGDAVLFALRPMPVDFDLAKVTDIDDGTYYVDDLIDLADVTGDDIPEIVFHTGWRCADNTLKTVHFLQYVGGGHDTAAFREIQDFAEDKWSKQHFIRRWTLSAPPQVGAGEQLASDPNYLRAQILRRRAR